MDLEKIKKIKEEIRSIEKTILKINSEKYLLKSSSFSQKTGNKAHTFEDKVDSVIDLEDALKKRRQELKDIQLRAFFLINEIDDGLARTVLIYYFINNYKIKEIVQILNYSERYIYKIYKRGIDEFNKLNKKSSS